MSTDITLTPGVLPKDCFSTFQDQFNTYVESIQASLGDTAFRYIISDSAPDAADQDKLWIKTSSGLPVRSYIYSSGSWVWPHEIPASDSRLIIYKGTSASVDTLDGGVAGTVGSASGPFWEIDTDLSGKFPLGVGTLESGTVVGEGDTGGEERNTLSVNELPAHSHSFTLNGYNSSQDSNSGNEYGFDGKSPQSLKTDDVGGGESHNNMPPYYGIYFIKRTARKYYVG